MSHFYGTLRGSRGGATRCGTKGSGVTTIAASWDGAVSVRLWHDEATHTDKYEVVQMRWHGRGIQETLAVGTIGKELGSP